MTVIQNALTKASVNNAGRDPIQGFDVDVYVLDQATGQQLMIGRFTSFQLTVRNATEPYLEFNQRIPRMLDGEFQFGWVLERGLLDTRVLENTFGLPHLYREARLNRSGRLIVTVDINAEELDESENNIRDEGGADALAGITESEGAPVAGLVETRNRRDAIGAYRLLYCKVDSLTLGAMAGRSVVAARWEGLCEGIMYFDKKAVQTTAGLSLPASFQTTEQLANAARATSQVPSWALEWATQGFVPQGTGQGNAGGLLGTGVGTGGFQPQP